MQLNSYVICATPRTGSNLLCEALSSTGVAGRPLEYLNLDYRSQFLQAWGASAPVPDSTFLQLALIAGTTSNGVFAAKVHWYQLEQMATCSSKKSVNCVPFQSEIPNVRYIFLRRRDKLRQAISWYRASCNKEWCAIDGYVDPRANSNWKPSFDYSRVKHCEAILRNDEQHWVHHFAKHGITPLTVEYQDLCADLVGQVRRVLSFVGDSDANSRSIKPPRLRQQRDSLTEEWVHAYITEERSNHMFPVASYGPWNRSQEGHTS